MTETKSTCVGCGAKISTGDGTLRACEYCGAVQPGSAAPPQFSFNSSAPPVMPQTQAGKGLAAASMILGIISILDPIPPYILGLILGVVGLILANQAKKQGNFSGLRKAGLVLSIIGIAFNALAFIGTVF